MTPDKIIRISLWGGIAAILLGILLLALSALINLAADPYYPPTNPPGQTITWTGIFIFFSGLAALAIAAAQKAINPGGNEPSLPEAIITPPTPAPPPSPVPPTLIESTDSEPGCLYDGRPVHPPFPWPAAIMLTLTSLLLAILLSPIIGFIPLAIFLIWRNAKKECPTCHADPPLHLGYRTVGFDSESIAITTLLPLLILSSVVLSFSHPIFQILITQYTQVSS